MARLIPEYKQLDELSVEDVAAITEIARKQAALMNQLAEALDAADILRVLGVARELVGLEKQVKQQ